MKTMSTTSTKLVKVTESRYALICTWCAVDLLPDESYCFLQAVTDEFGFQYEDMEQRRALEEV